MTTASVMAMVTVTAATVTVAMTSATVTVAMATATAAEKQQSTKSCGEKRGDGGQCSSLLSGATSVQGGTENIILSTPPAESIILSVPPNEYYWVLGYGRMSIG